MEALAEGTRVRFWEVEGKGNFRIGEIERASPDTIWLTSGHVMPVSRLTRLEAHFGPAPSGWRLASSMAIGAGVGVATSSDPGEIAEQVAQDAGTVGLVSGIALALVLFVAYFAGGYVAGRMARFDGAKQGVAVWVWAVLIAIVLAVLGAVAGEQFNVLRELNSFPRIPIGEGALTTGGIIALVVAVLIPLVAAVLGGLAGMRFHRKVDQVGIDHQYRSHF